ncbi:MAG: hypothetical protein ACRC5T_02390 [Cetobacterium sp.]
MKNLTNSTKLEAIINDYKESNSVKTSNGNINRLPAGIKKAAKKGIKKAFNHGAGYGYINHSEILKKEGYELELVNFDPFIPEISTVPNIEGCEIVMSNNVLNVIKDDEILESVLNELESFGLPVHITIYEGDKTNVGTITKIGTYQRNMKAINYNLELRGYQNFNGVWIKPATPTEVEEIIEDLEWNAGINITSNSSLMFQCYEYTIENHNDLKQIAEIASTELEFEGITYKDLLKQLTIVFNSFLPIEQLEKEHKLLINIRENPEKNYNELSELEKEIRDNETRIINEKSYIIKVMYAIILAEKNDFEFYEIMASVENNEVYLSGTKENSEDIKVIDIQNKTYYKQHYNYEMELTEYYEFKQSLKDDTKDLQIQEFSILKEGDYIK